MEATGQSGVPQSYFHEPSLASWCDNFGLSHQQFSSKKDTLSALFDTAIHRGTGDTGVFGLRLQRHSFAFFIQQLRYLHPELASDVQRIQAVFGNTLFIYLTRPNKLDQAISRLKAEQTGLWHRAADGSELERLTPPREAVYDSAGIARHIAELTRFDEEWLAWFERENLSPFRISYEALSVAPLNALETVLSMLGLDREISRDVSPPTAKLSDDVSRAWAERYHKERAS